MQVKDALRWGASRLREKGVQDALIEAEILLRHLLSISRSQFYAGWGKEFPQENRCSFFELVDRRVRGEPTAYLTGHREFYGLEFLVDSRVLIPRPESELLVDLAQKHLVGLGLTSSPPILVDIGTGSGALAITLAKYLPNAVVYATDISPEALEVAAINCQRHGVSDRVVLIEGDLLEPLPGQVDVLVSNPPYVAYREMEALPREIRDHEPFVALDGGLDGLEAVRRLLLQAGDKLRPGGGLFLEIGYGQGDEVWLLARALFPGAKVVLEKDLSGIDRVLAIYTQLVRHFAVAGVSGRNLERGE